MSDIEKTEEEKMQTRRKLLTSAGRVAITAPAVALLLSATALPAAAAGYNLDGTPGGGDTDGDPFFNAGDDGIGGDDSTLNDPNGGEADGVSP